MIEWSQRRRKNWCPRVITSVLCAAITPLLAACQPTDPVEQAVRAALPADERDEVRLLDVRQVEDYRGRLTHCGRVSRLTPALGEETTDFYINSDTGRAVVARPYWGGSFDECQFYNDHADYCGLDDFPENRCAEIADGAVGQIGGGEE